ncbi:EDEM2 [Bugula neritina]|uniref:EDEM2 n=1 Tax=Bugula neritina TaxID=10212 RepID=A0A7J7JPF2_BUGNE|nr:EDEM2 [Bugula neritina]
MFRNSDYLTQLQEYIEKFEETLKKDDWYLWVNMKSGAVLYRFFNHWKRFGLAYRQSQSYYIHSPFRKPSMMGEADKGLKTILNYFQVWEQFGATPEFYSLTKLSPTKGREGYPLRPELVESAMYIYQATKDPQMLHIGASI